MLISIRLLIISFTSKAQDNNYWNQMPGSRSGLMGGAVVAGVRDNSAVFYNPGALGFVDSNTVSISADAYQVEIANIQNGGGNNVNYSSNNFQDVPLVSISGIFKLKKNSKSSFGYMLFTKNQTSNNFSYRFDGTKDTSILAGDGYTSRNAGVEYIGDYNLQTSLNELWGGVCYSYQINEHISIGLSPFIAYRTQSLTSSFVARAFPDSTSNFRNENNEYDKTGNDIAIIQYDDNEDIAFSNIREINKIGIAFDYGNLKVGAAFTSKSINLGGRATIARDIAWDGGYAFDSVLHTKSYDFNARQTGIKSTYISPYSISLGIEYKLGKTTFAFTGEHFGAVAAYNLATPDSTPFYRPVWFNNNHLFTIGAYPVYSNEFLRIVEASKSVTDYAVAVQQEVSKKIDIVTSFRTDFTSYTQASEDVLDYLFNTQSEQPGQRLSFSNVNLYHVTLGAILKNKKSDIHLGFTYSFGTNISFQPLNNIASPTDYYNANSNNLGDIPMYNSAGNYIQNATYKYTAISLLVGYTYHID